MFYLKEPSPTPDPGYLSGIGGSLSQQFAEIAKINKIGADTENLIIFIKLRYINK